MIGTSFSQYIILSEVFPITGYHTCLQDATHNIFLFGTEHGENTDFWDYSQYPFDLRRETGYNTFCIR